MGNVSSIWKSEDMRFSDFQLLASHCARTVLHFLPFGDRVSFLPLDTIEDDSEWLSYLLSINEVQKKEIPSYSENGRFLFLPLYTGDISLVAICAIEVIDYSFAKDVSVEWLLDRCRVISRECALLKRLYLDPLTGFLNGTFFVDTLAELLTDNNQNYVGDEKNRSAGDLLSIVFIEVSHKGSNHNATFNYLNRAGHFLLSCSSANDVFGYLGNGVFGFLWPDTTEKQSHQKVRNLLNWLKREDFSKIHIGIVSFGLYAEQEKFAGVMLDKAWQALSEARTRGPYAFFFYESVQRLHAHPLGGYSKEVQEKMSGMWRGIDQFAVVLMHCDQDSGTVDQENLMACWGPGLDIVPINHREVFLFCAGVSAKDVLHKVKEVKAKLSQSGGITYSMGIAAFPHHTFSKCEIPVNAGKALLHTYFYGPDTVTIFNGLSLNVSGDIYYEAGDMLGAAREYRKGLSIEPENTNLLNSLGETYAQMNRHRQAKQCFSEVLTLDQHHYMALYNSGVASVMLGEEENSLKFFEKGLFVVKGSSEAQIGEGIDKIDIDNDHVGLFFQLGRLYCKKGMFNEAIPLLEQSIALVATENERGSNALARRTLAEAYKGLGQNVKAISLLQAVLNFNPYDSDALSILGELYELEGQGDDIALSLCLKAAEIDQNRPEFYYRIARIYYKLNRLEEAVDVIKKSLKLKRKNLEALFLAGQIFQKLGRKRDASRKYTSVLRLDSNYKDAIRALKGISG